MLISMFLVFLCVDSSFSSEPSETTVVPSASVESSNQQRLRAVGALEVFLRGQSPP